MQGSFTRRQFLKAGGLLGLGTVLGVQSCESLFGPKLPRLTFQQLDSSCATEEETVLLEGGPGRISFSGLMQTPTPCYDLQAELITMRCEPTERCPNTYEIAITAKAQDVICVECIGSVNYRGEIRSLRPGLYTIAVTHDGHPIAEEQVQVE